MELEENIIIVKHANITIDDNTNDSFRCPRFCKYLDKEFASIFSKYCNATIMPTNERDKPFTYKYSGSINSIKNENIPVNAWYILNILLS